MKNAAEVKRNGEVSSEEERIRNAYARRAPSSLYSMFNPGYVLMIQDRQRRSLEALNRSLKGPLSEQKILDLGCGTGGWIRDLIQWGATPSNITGIDLIPVRIEEARSLLPKAVQLRCESATNIDAADGSFDIVIQSTVFTSILDAAVKDRIAREIVRVLRPGGTLLWYDFFLNNPANKDVRGVRRAEIVALFPGCEIDLRRATLAPPLARRLAPISTWACDLLATVPFLCSHYLGTIQKV